MAEKVKFTKIIAGKYDSVLNTVFSEPKPDKQDRIEIEIGDSKQPDFKPQVKIKRWDNEVNASFRFIDDSADTVAVSNKSDQIIWKKGDHEIHLYELPADSINEDGGFELEAVLNKKPSSNVLQFSIETKGLNFYYQGEPKPRKGVSGIQIPNRPENVIGSYAVYHDSKQGDYKNGNHYKTGKVFHIYRPKITDAAGAVVWGDLNIDGDSKILTITIPQDFLDTAEYPVIVDPTFGYTSAGGSSWQYEPDDYIFGYHPATSPKALTVDSIHIYTKANGSASNAECGIYKVSDNVLHGKTETISIGTTAAWNQLNIDSDGALINADYYLCVWFESSDFEEFYDEVVGYYSKYDSNTFDGDWPNPVSWDGSDWVDARISIYASYTDAAAGNPHYYYAQQ